MKQLFVFFVMPVKRGILFICLYCNTLSFMFTNSEPYGILLKGYKMKTEYSFRVSSAMQLKECGMECFLRSECFSISYQKDYLKCFLNSVNTSISNNYSQKVGYLSSDILTWNLNFLLTSVVDVLNDVQWLFHELAANPTYVYKEKSKHGNCFSRPCPKRTRCTLLTKGGHACIISECVDAPAFPPNVKETFQRRVGMTINHKCKKDYITNGTPSKIKCKADGNWIVYNSDFNCTLP